MDWDAAIEKHRDALKSVLAGLLVLAGFVGGRPATLPRHLHRAVLRLLRPAEAAVRRLVIVAARSIAVRLPPLRPRGRMRRQPRAPAATSFPLFDPLSRWGRIRRRPPQTCMPRIAFPGVTALSPIRRPPMPMDPIDTALLARRLAALGRVLDNLPQQALRFARWQARKARSSSMLRQPGTRAATRFRRVWPLRPGPPPGRHPARGHRPAHAVHAILTDVHGLALWVLEPADTS